MNTANRVLMLIEFHENPLRLEHRQEQFKKQDETKSILPDIKRESSMENTKGINLNLNFKFHIIYFKCWAREYYNNKYLLRIDLHNSR